MRTFYTGDSHFGHWNIVEYSDRRDPSTGLLFSDINHHDAYLIDAWNQSVGKNDRVIHVGDFAYRCDPKRARAIFSRLNGQKWLVIGNHDDQTTLGLPWAAPPQHILKVEDSGTRVVACHFGLRVWEGQRRGAIHIYGHSHGRLPGNGASLDVGVDCWDFRPVTIHEVKARLAQLPPLVDPEAGGDDFGGDGVQP